MLEHNSLVLRPGGASSPWTILDPTGRALGFACWQVTGSPLWAWLVPSVLEVREQEDAPLVFTVRRGWGWRARFAVGDAEGRLIGRLAESAILDRQGRPIARYVLAADGGGWRGPGGEELAHLTMGDSDRRLTFALASGPDPFLRMLLLAAALTR
jgi:hypothetical protein